MSAQSGGYLSNDERLLRISHDLRVAVAQLSFHLPVTWTYNPLYYAWEPYCDYLRRYGHGPKEVVFLGMNPGPWGMVQTGVPFGEVERVRRWLLISGKVSSPEIVHPKRPVMGFACGRSEVSGRRLWDFFRGRFGTPRRFFAHHFVANYCPLMFLDAQARNLTPDRLCANDRIQLFRICDAHLVRIVETLKPRWVVGIGRFAQRRAELALASSPVQVAGILHPSPASPAANRDWEGQAYGSLVENGIWTESDPFGVDES